MTGLTDDAGRVLDTPRADLLIESAWLRSQRVPRARVRERLLARLRALWPAVSDELAELAVAEVWAQFWATDAELEEVAR